MHSILRTLVSSVSALLLLLFTSSAQAVVDDYSTGPGQTPGDGLDDLWQSVYNGWSLLPGGDEDFDGCSNLIECIAGSNPWLANDCLKVGGMIIGGTNIIMNFDAKKGKEYQVWESSSPGGPPPGEPGSQWIEKSGISKVASMDGMDSLVFPKPPATDRKFYRIESKDHDADGDGVSDWAEAKLGTDVGPNASGGAASDLETMKSLISLTATPGISEAYEKEGTHATIQLRRTYGTMPLTVDLAGLPGTTNHTKSNASAGDFIFKNLAGTPTNTVTLPENEGVSAPYTVARVAAAPDATEEVPEMLKVSIALPGAPEGVAGPAAVVTLKDADPNIPANRKLYVAFLGREENVVSTASGYATALVNGDNNSASISIVFNNLSSEQNTAYIRIENDLEVLPLPLGQVSGANWNIRAAQTAFTDQAMLDALQDGRLYVSITTANNPTKEIWGYFNKATGTEVFDDTRTDLEAPEIGSAGWVAPTGDALEREIWRFMSQSTFGGTTALYTEIRAMCDAAIAGGGSYIDGLSAWLDKQIDPAQTPTISLRKLVMAADMEEFLLRGNKPITYNNNPLFNGASYGVSYVNGMPVANTSVNNNPNNAAYPQYQNNRREWWTLVTQAPDQVRQRVAHALHQICVISERDATVLAWHYGAANYWDMMAENAFGKYRTLLEKVSLNPMMGVYLTSVANRALYESSAGSGLWISPDENYAREIMQLFSIGLILRHPDGSLQLSSEGLPIPTYDNNDITELARVFTGFSFGARHGNARVQTYGGNGLMNTTDTRVSPAIYQNGTTNNIWFGRDNGHLYWQTSWIHPMKVMGRIGGTVYHDFAAKTLLNGKHGAMPIDAKTVNNASPFTPASDSTTHDWAYADVKLAHDCLAGDAAAPTYGNGTSTSPGHTNTPVNICRWLIQRLVTSNPSAGYIYRVQNVYRQNNGLLGPVIKAILLDYEARSLQLADSLISQGKIKEPLVHMTSLMRQFRAYSGASVNVLRDMNVPFSDTDAPMTSGYDAAEVAKFSTANLNPPSKPAAWPAGPFRFRIDSTRNNLGQSPQDAPTVFNWFYPDFQPAGRFAQNGLYAPELQIATEAAEVAKVNFLYAYTWMNLAGMSNTPGVGVANFIFQNSTATPAARFSTNGGSSFLGWPAAITLTEANWDTGINVTMVPINNSQFSQMASTNIRYGISGNAVGYTSSVATLPTAVTLKENEILDENIIVRHTGGNAWVAEGGFGDTVMLSLSIPPMVGATVTVTPASLNGEVSFSPAAFTFDSTNWNVEQTLTLTAVNDADIEDSGSGNDGISLAITSEAANWSGLPAVSIPVQINDNDGGLGVLITQSGGSTDVAETTNSSGTGTDSYTIALTKKPTANVTITMTSNAQLGITNTTGGFTTTTTTRTFTPTDGQAASSGTSGWNVAQTVVVRGNNDTTSESTPHIGTVTHSIATAAGGYPAGLQIQQVVAPIADNDTPAIIVAHTDGSTRVEEGGGTDIITVQLRNGTVPNQNVSVTLGSGQVRFSPSALTFTAANYNVPQQVTVSALDDTIVEGMHETFIYSYSTSSGTNYNQSAGVNLPVTIFDNDDARLRLIETAGSTVVNEDGTTDTYQIALSRAPAAGSTTTVAITVGSGLTISPAGPFTFTDANWNTAQTITVGSTNDGTAEPRATAILTHTITSTDPLYDKAHTPVLAVTIDDNDPPLNITLTGFSTQVREGGITGTGGTPSLSDTFTVALGRTPGATTPVTVNLIAGSQFTVSPASLSFANSSTTQTVTVTAVDDNDAEPTVHATPLNFAIVSNDTYFNGAPQPPVMVYVTDNDSPGVSIVEGGEITQTTESSTTQDTYTVVLTQAPTANVSILVNGGSQSLVSGTSSAPTAATATLTFTPANWSTAQTVRVLATNDSLPESSRHLAPITHTITTTAGTSYEGVSVASVNNVITDNDLTVAANKVRVADTSGSSVTEHGNPATDTFTVVLGVAPTSPVTVSFASPDNQLSLTGLSSITFTPTAGQAVSNGTGGWNVTQTLTFRANDDKIVEPFLHWGTFSATVVSDDPNYSGISIPVALTSSLRDNDGPSILVTPTEGSTQLTEVGRTDSYSVVLSQEPSADVTVTVSPDAQLTAGAASLTFTSADWNVPQSVTLTAIDDTTAEAASHPGIVSHSASSADPLFHGISVPAVIAAIFDNESPGLTVTETGGSTTITEGDGTGDTINIRLNTRPAPGEVVTITLHPPTFLVPVPQHGKTAGYFTNDLGGSSERDNIVFDYTENILLYRNTFYGHLSSVYGGTIPGTPSSVNIQNAHWAATKAVVDKLDLWFSFGSMKARWPVLIEPNQPAPAPLPGFNPRQAIMDAIYRHNGGSGSPSTTRYSAASTFNPQNPRNGSNALDNEICDRVRWASYLTTVGATAFSAH